MPDCPTPVRRILVCQLRQIGDVLLATPSVEMLAKRFPEAEIHFFTEKKCTPMIVNNPAITHIWELDKKTLPTLAHELRFYWKIAQQQYDIIIDFQQLPRIRWVVGFSRAAVRLTSPPPWYLRFLYTTWHQPEPAYAGIYKASLLTPLGIAWQGEKPRIFLTEAEKEEAKQLLHGIGIANKEGSRFLTLDITHKHSTRRWPKEYYARLIDELGRLEPDLRFLLPYGPGELPEVLALKSLCANQQAVLVPPDMLSLRQLAACMEYASMHIGNCSSPRHLAVATGLPSITILGSTSAGWTYPSAEHIHIRKGLPCQACNKNTCPAPVCLTSLTPDEALPKIVAHWREFGAFRTQSNV